MLIPDCDAKLQADFSFFLTFCNLRTGLLHLVAYNSPFRFLWVFRVWRLFKFILWYLWCLQPQFCFWFYDFFKNYYYFFFKSTLSKPLSTFSLFIFVHRPYSFVEPEMLKPNKSKPEIWRMSELFFPFGRKWAVLQTPYLEQALLFLIFTSPPQSPDRNLYIICLLGNESH